MSVIDEYFATIGDQERVVLEHVRQIVYQVAPDVEEVISYNLPAFRLKGKVILGFYVNKHFMSLYPFSGGVLSQMQKSTAGFGQTKSALQFTLEHQLPDETIREMLHLRLQEADLLY